MWSSSLWDICMYLRTYVPSDFVLTWRGRLMVCGHYSSSILPLFLFFSFFVGVFVIGSNRSYILFPSLLYRGFV